MSSTWRPITSAILSTFFVLLLTACGLTVTNPALFASGDAIIVSVALTGPGSVMLGAQSQYAATVAGSSNSTVNWSVNGIAGGNSSVGSISTKGLYTAPASAPQSSKVTITATSAADPSASKSLSVALATPPPTVSGGSTPTITIAISGATSVTLGSSSQYLATVTGTSNTGVSWAVNGTAGGSATVGTISTTGLYQAPASAPSSSSVTITATSVADPSVSQSLAVALAAPPTPPNNGGGGSAPAITVAISGATSVTLGTSSQYSATVTGTNNTGVSWAVNGTAGGSATVGTISATGLYQAPASAPSSSAVTITATSVADPSVSENLAVSLAAPPTPPNNGGGGSNPTVTLAVTGATTVTLGTTSQYAATVTGTSDKAVTWSVDGVAGGSATDGYISSNGLYTAPSATSAISKVTIGATSVADPSVSQSLSVALDAPTGRGDPTVGLAITGATTVALGTTSQYAATVTGSPNKAVTWSVDGVAGGSATDGYISSNGLYTAPSATSAISKVTIGATSVADPSVSQSLSVALDAPSGGGNPTVTLAVTGATTVTLGTTSQYAATVTGTSDKAVTWSVDGVAGGSATDGYISSNGLYTAPSDTSVISKVTIGATSVADPSVSQNLSVALVAPKTPVVTVALSGPTAVTLGTAAQYTATVTGTTNSSVTWSVNGVAGGDSSVGTISTKGLYTAPASTSQISKVTIKATSVADSSASQSLAITLDTPTPTVTLTLSGATSVTLGTSSQYAAVVSGTSNTGVSWTVNGVAGGNTTVGTISTSGLYNAPTSAPTTSTVTIAATSLADTSVAKSIVVTLAAPTSRIPANAIAATGLNGKGNWAWNHDPGTPGSSQGSTVYPITNMSSDGQAREFYMTYSAKGGEIYHLSFATDKNATHFVYDTYVYVTNPSQLANLEMDMNDVMSDGRTVILGTQCSTYSKSWEYTVYSNGGFHWVSSNIACNPETWSANAWHHIQIASHRDTNGVATYDWISFDGQYSDFQNATAPSAAALGWAIGDLLINFQIDGSSAGSGSNTIYTDNLTVYRW